MRGKYGHSEKQADPNKMEMPDKVQIAGDIFCSDPLVKSERTRNKRRPDPLVKRATDKPKFCDKSFFSMPTQRRKSKTDRQKLWLYSKFWDMRTSLNM